MTCCPQKISLYLKYCALLFVRNVVDYFWTTLFIQFNVLSSYIMIVTVFIVDYFCCRPTCVTVSMYVSLLSHLLAYLLTYLSYDVMLSGKCAAGYMRVSDSTPCGKSLP